MVVEIILKLAGVFFQQCQYIVIFAVIVDIQRNIADKEAQLQALNMKIELQESKNQELERQLEAGSEEDNLGRVAFEQYGYGYIDEHIYIDSSGS